MSHIIKDTGKSIAGFFGAVNGQQCRMEVVFNKGDGAVIETHHLKAHKKQPEADLPSFENSDNVCGQVRISPLQQNRIEHQGIRAQLVGVIETGRGGHGHEFLSLSRELAPAGDIRVSENFDFEFSKVNMDYDSYRGDSVRLRYFIRITVCRTIAGIVNEFPFWVANPLAVVPSMEPIKLEVGIEDCLHLEFTYSSATFGIKDCVHGKIYFVLVRINLKKMELEVRRRETIGSGNNMKNDMQTLYKYEIMDGAPVKGETVPVRFYLAPLDLTPTYEKVHNKFSVKYFLNLVLVDMEDRRYFKQHEITLVRRPAAPALDS